MPRCNAMPHVLANQDRQITAIWTTFLIGRDHAKPMEGGGDKVRKTETCGGNL